VFLFNLSLKFYDHELFVCSVVCPTAGETKVVLVQKKYIISINS